MSAVQSSLRWFTATSSLARRAKHELGKSYGSQLRDILRLRSSLSRLGPSEYYQFQLYDDRRYSFAEKLKFMGWRGRQLLDEAFNRRTWHVVTSDKVITYLLLSRLGLPTPKTFAVFDIRSRAIPEVSYLATRSELRHFLERATFPFFAKPVDAALGRGALVIERFESGRDEVKLARGGSIAFDALYSQCLAEAETGGGGYLFQEVVRPDPALAQLTGGRLPGMRLIALLHHGSPVLTHAVLKIPTGANITDNFDGGKGGNLLGTIDIETGELGGVFGFDGSRYVQVHEHPDTHTPFAGFAIPGWNQHCSTVLAASTLFPGLELQHWDVAIAAGGPQLLEVNVNGCLELPQIAGQRGFFGGLIREAFREKVHSARRGRNLLRPDIEWLPEPALALREGF